MGYFFYGLSLLPNFNLNLFGVSALLRFYALALAFRITFSRKDMVFLYVSLLHVVFAALFYFQRNFSLIDVGYSISFLYIFVFLGVVRKNLRLFEQFMSFSLTINVVFALIQTLALSAGFDSSKVMIFQNSHSLNYVIPHNSYVGFLYRVPGFFVESAPFSLYLSLCFVFFRATANRLMVFFCLLGILLSGAKVGFLFLLLYVFRYFYIYSIRIFLLYLTLFFSCLVYFYEYILKLILNLAEYISGLGSIYKRFEGFISTLDQFDSHSVIYGLGYVSTASIRDQECCKRGIDFFSIYILSNGLASIVLLAPIVFYLYNNLKSVGYDNARLLLVFLFLSLMTMGSLLNIHYALFIAIVVYLNVGPRYKNDQYYHGML